MLDTIFTISTNYVDVVHNFMQLGNDYFAPMENRKRLGAQIEKDLTRTVYLSRRYDLEKLKAPWRKRDVSMCYTQGNINAANISRIFVLNHTFGEYSKTIISKNEMDRFKFFKGVKGCGFAFIDNYGSNCGLSISYQKEAPDFFTVAFIRHTTKDPLQREVTIFQSTDNEFYPDLKQICGSAYLKGSVLSTNMLKQEILKINGLPEEVNFFINDVIKNNGQLEISNIETLEDKLLPNVTNEKIIFKKERYLHANQSFWSRNKSHIFASGKISVLAVIAMILSAVGVMSFFCMIMILALNFSLVLAAVYSWGLTISKEFNFSMKKNNCMQSTDFLELKEIPTEPNLITNLLDDKSQESLTTELILNR